MNTERDDYIQHLLRMIKSKRYTEADALKKLHDYDVIKSASSNEQSFDDIKEISRQTQVNETIYPKDLYDKLDKIVVNQTEAKKGLSTAVASYLTAVSKNTSAQAVKAPRIGLLGPTGSGKTYLLQTLDSETDLDFLFVNCSEFHASGWRGKNLLNLFEESTNLHEKERAEFLDLVKKRAKSIIQNDEYISTYRAYKEALQKTVVVFDEFDKIAGAGNVEGNTATAIKDLMSDYMSILSGRDIVFKHEDQEFKFSTANVPIVCLGAYVGLDKHEEIKENNTIGFGQDYSTEVKRKPLKSALKEYGFMPELLGRLTTLIKLEKLTKEDYLQILDKNILVPFITQFGLYDIAIRFSNEFKADIAEKAMKSDEGARALSELVEVQLRNHLFNAEQYKYACITFEKCGIMEAKITRLDKKQETR